MIILKVYLGLICFPGILLRFLRYVFRTHVCICIYSFINLLIFIIIIIIIIIIIVMRF